MAWKKELFKAPTDHKFPFEIQRKIVTLGDGSCVELEVKVYHTLDKDIGLARIGFKQKQKTNDD